MPVDLLFLGGTAWFQVVVYVQETANVSSYGRE
jgi:hypothetical protein